MADKHPYKDEKVVSLGIIDGDVSIDNCFEIQPAEGTEIHISKELSIKGNTIVKGSVFAQNVVLRAPKEIIIEGDFTVDETVDVQKGNLIVKGNLKADTLEADRAVHVMKDLNCTVADVSGVLKIDGNATAISIDIGGSLKIEGDAHVESMDIGGSGKIGGEIQCENLDFGGAVSVAHGRIHHVDCGGRFSSSGAIEIDELDVGGSATVGPDSKIEDVDIGGAFKCRGNFQFGTIDAGGAIKLEGDAQGRSVDVSGVLKTTGSLTLSEDLDIHGAAKIASTLIVNGNIDASGSLKVGEKLEALSMDVSGAISGKHIQGKAKFRLRHGGRVSGLVEAKTIRVGRKASGETFYGETIHLERNASAHNLYGNSIRIERGAEVTGKIIYTENIKQEENTKLEETPEKRDALPPVGNLLQ